MIENTIIVLIVVANVLGFIRLKFFHGMSIKKTLLFLLISNIIFIFSSTLLGFDVFNEMISTTKSYFVIIALPLIVIMLIYRYFRR